MNPTPTTAPQRLYRTKSLFDQSKTCHKPCRPSLAIHNQPSKHAMPGSSCRQRLSPKSGSMVRHFPHPICTRRSRSRDGGRRAGKKSTEIPRVYASSTAPVIFFFSSSTSVQQLLAARLHAGHNPKHRTSAAVALAVPQSQPLGSVRQQCTIRMEVCIANVLQKSRSSLSNGRQHRCTAQRATSAEPRDIALCCPVGKPQEHKWHLTLKRMVPVDKPRAVA